LTFKKGNSGVLDAQIDWRSSEGGDGVLAVEFLGDDWRFEARRAYSRGSRNP